MTFQTIKNFFFIGIFIAILWWVLKPIEIINGQTIIENANFFFLLTVAIVFFEMEFWRGIARLFKKDPGKLIPHMFGILAISWYLLTYAPNIFAALGASTLVISLIWTVVAFYIGLRAITGIHPITVALYIIGTVVEAFDPTLTVAGFSLGAILFFIIIGVEWKVGHKSLPMAYLTAFFLGWSMYAPSIIANIFVLALIALRKVLIPFKVKEEIEVKK